MKKLKKDINVYFAVSLIASILFVVGVPMIPIFAGKNWALMAVGIVFAVFGFYGMPLLWVKYGSFFKLKRVLEAITLEHILSNREIAMQLQIREREVKNIIIKLINKQYLVGYLYDGEKLVLNQKEKPQKTVIINKCNNCGGALKQNEDGMVCPYCGAIYTKK